MQYNLDHPGEFIAIPGIEWGNTATGNHVNVFGAHALPPDTIEYEDYDALYAWAAQHAEFVQFNHPNSWKAKSNRNHSVGNFGIALYDSEAAFVSGADPIVKTIAIICTVHGGHLSGQHRHSTAKTHREMQWERYYRQHLNMGFRLSPAANQDTHHTNWGTVTAARTAAWADSASYQDLMAAFKANRVYATEDDEMAVVYQVRYGNRTYWMGETVPLEDEEEDVEILVKVWQGEGADDDPADEGPYSVHIISDWDGTDGREASVWDTVTNVPANQAVTIPVNVLAGEYIYLQMDEQGGQDNPVGDGEDEFNNETGEHDADGQRDDVNDSAWTSPIWFARPTLFVWSRNSGLYHGANCWAVQRIGEANKRTGTEPPEGKTKHDCHP